MSEILSAIPLARLTVCLTAAAVVGASLVSVSHDAADAAGACRIQTSTKLDSTTHFAGGAVLRRYTAHAQGAAKGGYDQTGKVIMASYPRDSFPALINTRVGMRETVGAMAKQQRRRSLGAINGDFFIFPDVGGETDIEMSRGPMIRNGRVIRATAQPQRVVGVTKKRHPFGGMFAVRGTVRAEGSSKSTKIRSMNWQNIKGGGVNIYTSAWSDTIPRPKGRLEWVLNDRNVIRKVRSPARNNAERGDSVRSGTRVLAFSKNATSAVRGTNPGTKVFVNLRQSTDTGVELYTAVGRGLPLVLNGVAAPLGCSAYAHSKAARPRTFVGWNAKGSWRSFTVPGKTFDGIGLRTGGFGLANAANIAKSLGMRRAYELDGGGSTTMWTRSKTGQWTRRDLYGVNTAVCACQRPMTNGLAFVQR